MDYINSSYLSVLTPARKYFEGCVEKNPVKKTHFLGQYFKAAESINPCVARMAFQQAHCDINLEYLARTEAGEFSTAEIGEINKAVMDGAREVFMDVRLYELEKRIKSLYKKTGSKRIGIAYSLLDSEPLGLSSIKEENRYQKKIMTFIKSFIRAK